MFVRFVRPVRLENSDARDGFFCAAYEMREDKDLDPYSAEQLEEFLAWFRANLTIPNTFTRSKGKAAHERETKGLSWFKPEAKQVLDKAYELIFFLEAHGYAIDTIRSDRIGYVIYEDDAQIVAEPFADTPI